MSSLWAIACYFNPIGYRRRRQNYRAFRRRLGVPLVTAELIYEGRPGLGEEDADILLQLHASDVLWQKEHLLSLALRAVPPECEKVVWLDCDLVFDRDDWPERVSRLLDSAPLVQVFGSLQEVRVEELATPPSLDRLGAPSLSYTRKLRASSLPSGGESLASATRSAPKVRTGMGIGWAFSRLVFETNGFYNGSVIGGNDRAMVCAALGQFDVAERNWQMNERQKEHYRAWAEPHYDAIRGEVVGLDQRVLHLWHGDLQRRGYGLRHQGFAAFGFNPWQDVTCEEGGPLAWATDKPEMHRYVYDWFVSRREDG